MKHVILLISLVVLKLGMRCDAEASADDFELDELRDLFAHDINEFDIDADEVEDVDEDEDSDDVEVNDLVKRDPWFWSSRRRRCAAKCRNPCKGASCSKYRGASCSNVCCQATWRIPKKARNVDCACNREIVQCAKNPCANAVCEKKKKAKCVENYCGGCNYEFYYQEKKVEECGSEFARKSDPRTEDMQPRMDFAGQASESEAMDIPYDSEDSEERNSD